MSNYYVRSGSSIYNLSLNGIDDLTHSSFFILSL